MLFHCSIHYPVSFIKKEAFSYRYNQHSLVGLMETFPTIQITNSIVQILAARTIWCRQGEDTALYKKHYFSTWQLELSDAGKVGKWLWFCFTCRLSHFRSSKYIPQSQSFICSCTCDSVSIWTLNHARNKQESVRCRNEKKENNFSCLKNITWCMQLIS